MPDTPEDRVMPIAIIGIGGRFPGDASTPERLWELLLQGKSMLGETPKDRFNVDAFYHPQPDRQGSQNFRGGHFMEGPIDVFDAPFFSITPSEAKAMDPQQRMCLEVAYETMENAGVCLDSVSGSDTSCYVGCFNHDYQNLLNRDPESLPTYNATGTEASCLSNRISWCLNLAGPSMTVDTACSSSLIALHLACQSLRLGESKMALVGGVNIMSSVEMNMQLSNLQMISPDSKSQTFDAKANGYGRGEGVCFVLIKPLQEAIQDGDVIRAVIRNTGSNQDGNTPGLTLPSRTMQERLIRRVYEEAGLNMADTGYFEAHGTGTVAGDSTETRALGETIGKSKSPGQPLWVGSVKANIGHLEGGSGLAALIKAIYVLERGIIPPQIWFEKMNPRIRAEEWNLAVPTEVTPWPYEGPRRASVNSFGFAGANAHVILEDAFSFLMSRGGHGRHNVREGDYPKLATEQVNGTKAPLIAPLGLSAGNESSVELHPKLIVWSSHEQSGLDRIFQSCKKYIAGKLEQACSTERENLLSDLAHTTAIGRTKFPWRSFTVCAQIEQIMLGSATAAPPIRSSQRPKFAFVFTGQGAQHYAMGKSLMQYEVYSSSIRAADQYLRYLGCSWSLVEELSRDATSSRVSSAEFSQPLCIALQVALVDLLQSVGVWPPEVVIGHSGGETAAAYAKGALSREAAWTVAYHRGRVCAMLPEVNPELDGDMLAAGISEEEAYTYIDHVSTGTLVVACVNSPSSVTLSGDVPAIIEAERLIKKDGHLAKKLGVGQAYHSPHMSQIAEIYRDLLKDVHGMPETSDSPKMFSCVTGDAIDNTSLGGDYWATNLVSQVKFSQAMKSLVAYSSTGRKRRPKGYCSVNLMVEIGPHGALQGPVKQILKAAEAQCTSISLLDRKKDAIQGLLEGIGTLFQHGFDADINLINNHGNLREPKLLVDLPPYPWNHSSRYWHESAQTSGYMFKRFPRKDLLGIRDNDRNNLHPRWRHYLRLSENPWMEDHQVQGKIIYPAAGMAIMALEGARELADETKTVEAYEISNMAIKSAIIIPKGEEGVETSLHMHLKTGESPAVGDDILQVEFSICSRINDASWIENCSGHLKVRYKSSIKRDFITYGREQENAWYKSEFDRACVGSLESVPSTAFYTEQAELGLRFGESFQNVRNIRKGQGQMVFSVHTPDIAHKMPQSFTHEHLVHPCTLDPIIHASLAILNDGFARKGPVVPTSIGRLVVSAEVPSLPGATFAVHSSATPSGLRDTELNIYASTEKWEKPLLILDQVRVTRLEAGLGLGETESSNESSTALASKMCWQPDISHVRGQDLQGPDSLAQFYSLMKMLGYKYPDLNVLELGARDGQIANKVLGALQALDDKGIARWLDSYTVCVGNDEQAESLHQEFQSCSPFLKVVQDSQIKTLELQTYHCILINCEGDASVNPDILAQARPLLKDLGLLILLPGQGGFKISFSANPLAGKLKELQLTTLDLVSQHDRNKSAAPSASFLVFRAKSKPPEPILKEVLIVGPSVSSDLCDSLMEQLHRQGVCPSYATLFETEEMDLTTKHSIVVSDLENPILFDITPRVFLILKRLLLESRSTTWVTSGATVRCNNPRVALALGLFRSVRQEHPELFLTNIDLETAPSSAKTDARTIVEIMDSRMTDNFDTEFAVRDGSVLIPRIHPDRWLNRSLLVLRNGAQPELTQLSQPDRPLTFCLGVPGSFDSVFFKDNPVFEEPLASDCVEIEIRASGLNSTDLLSALDQVSEPSFGQECSGIVVKVGEDVHRYQPGDRVFTWSPGSFGNFTRSPECMVHSMPVGMPFHVAASLPMGFCTAYHALVQCARLQEQEKVLIQDAAGVVGQAAIMVARNLGASIFATVASEEEKIHLVETYGISDDHIFHQFHSNVSRGIAHLTQGSGVNVVLNGLAGEDYRRALSCLNPFGRFIDLSSGSSALKTPQIPNNATIYQVDILSMYKTSLQRASQLLQNAMKFYYENNCQPVSPIHIMNYSQISDGLRLLRGGNRMGKIIFRPSRDDQVMVIPPSIKAVKFNTDATYIIVGGFGGLGQHIAKWTAENGVRNLVFLSRRGADHEPSKRFLTAIQAKGVNAVAYKCDIVDIKQVKDTIRQMAVDGLPPVRGIIQAAMSLADATFRQMTPNQWELSTNTKALGTWNLHCTAPGDLDFFIMLSSVSGIVGLRGQGNYAAGNTFLDALAHYRRTQGLPALSIDVGAVFDVGYMADKPEMKETMRSLGFIGLKGSELLGVIQMAINDQIDNSNSMESQVMLGLATGGYLASSQIDMPYYFSDPKLALLKQLGAAEQPDDGQAAPGLSEQLKNITSRLSAVETVSNALRARLAKQMMVDISDVDASKPVSGYGVDSLTAVDIRAWSLKETHSDISILDVVNNSSIMALAETIVGNSRLVCHEKLED